MTTPEPAPEQQPTPVDVEHLADDVDAAAAVSTGETGAVRVEPGRRPGRGRRRL